MTLNGKVKIKREKNDGHAVQWDAESIKKANQSVQRGVKLKDNPFHKNNPMWKKGDVVYKFSKDELLEYERCMDDIIYFAEKYAYLLTDNGYVNVKLRDYQIDLLRHLQKNKLSIVLASRQVGKTVTSSIFIAWYVCFHFDRNVLFCANKGETALEIVKKAKDIIARLPFFMKPGVYELNKGGVAFDNGCILHSMTTSNKTGIGFTIHVLFMDEFAHIPNEFVDDFYENIYPTLSSSSNGRIIITSTPNGHNKFEKLWKGSHKVGRPNSERQNSYEGFRIDWWQVPGRDDKWKQRQIMDLGSEAAFNRQFGNQFISSSSVLIRMEDLKFLEKNKTEFVWRELSGFEDLVEAFDFEYDNLLWHPDFDVELLSSKEEFFYPSLDIGEGIGKDYSVLNIFRLEPIPKKDYKYLHYAHSIYDLFRLNQVGIYRDNFTDPDKLGMLWYFMLTRILYQENARSMLEWNTYGTQTLAKAKMMEGDANKLEEELIMAFKHTVNARTKKVGLKLRKDNKPSYASKFKEKVSRRRINVTHNITVDEFKEYGRDNKGNYKGLGDNDDCFASSMNLVACMDTAYFTDHAEELFDYLPAETQRQIEEKIEGASYSEINPDSDDVFDVENTEYNKYINDLDADIF